MSRRRTGQSRKSGLVSPGGELVENLGHLDEAPGLGGVLEHRAELADHRVATDEHPQRIRGRDLPPDRGAWSWSSSPGL